MSSYENVKNNASFNSFLKNNEYNSIMSNKNIKTQNVNIDNSIEIKENNLKSLTTEEILRLYKNISQN